MHTDSLALLQLLRLSSPALPIGGYAYSQGLETACENNHVSDKDSLYSWINGIMKNSMQYLDIPIFARLYDCHSKHDIDQLIYWNQYLLASRETQEFFLEDTQMGQALIRLLTDLNIPNTDSWLKQNCSLMTAFSLACCNWKIEKKLATHAMLWAWCENQVTIGIKLIPLGQTNGQQVLSNLINNIESIISNGLALHDEEIGSTCPGLIMSSMQHEEQYTRLFRS